MADQGVIGAPHLLSHPTWLDTSSHLLRAAARSQWRQTPHSRGSRPAPRSRRHPAATPNRDPDPLAPLPPRRPPRPRPAPDAAAARPPPAGPAARPARRPAPPAWRAPRQGPGQGQGPLRRRWCQGLSSRRGRAHPFRPPASARAARHSLGCQVLRRRRLADRRKCGCVCASVWWPAGGACGRGGRPLPPCQRPQNAGRVCGDVCGARSRASALAGAAYT